MNYRQRAYESHDRGKYNLKITNSYYHFKNIQKIASRKSQFNSVKKTNSPKSKNLTTQPYKNYYVMRQNALYKKIINDIKTSKVTPKINLFYQSKEEKLKDYRRQNKTLENRQLLRENSNFRKRLKNQKSMIRIKDIDKDYKENHLKIMERFRKINEGRRIVLPPINNIVRRFSPKLIRKSSKKFDNSYNYGNSSSKDGESLHQEKNQPHENSNEKTKE